MSTFSQFDPDFRSGRFGYSALSQQTIRNRDPSVLPAGQVRLAP